MGSLRTVILTLLLATCLAGAQTFPEGYKHTNVWDFAKVLNETKEEHLQISCDSYQENHGSPVWIVTIKNLNEYGSGPERISNYCQWFLREKLGEYGADKNSILVLLSKDDRKARIELGEAWGRGWDGECERIMQSKGVPAFRQEKYSDGLGDMVRALNVMTTRKEKTSPAILAMTDWGSRIAPYSAFPPVAVLPSIVLCVALFALGLARTSEGKRMTGLLWLGLILAAATFLGGGVIHFFTDGYAEAMFEILFFIIIFVIIIFSDQSGRRRGWGYSSWDSGSSFGGGFDSGFSSGGGGFDFGGGGGGFDFGGGGGATGSW